MKGTSGMFAVCYRWRQTLHWLCKTTDVCLRFKLNCLKWTRRQNWDELEVTCFWQNFRWIIQVSDYFFETQLTEKETQEGAFKKTESGVRVKFILIALVEIEFQQYPVQMKSPTLNYFTYCVFLLSLCFKESSNVALLQTITIEDIDWLRLIKRFHSLIY